MPANDCFSKNFVSLGLEQVELKKKIMGVSTSIDTNRLGFGFLMNAAKSL